MASWTTAELDDGAIHLLLFPSLFHPARFMLSVILIKKFPDEKPPLCLLSRLRLSLEQGTEDIAILSHPADSTSQTATARLRSIALAQSAV